MTVATLSHLTEESQKWPIPIQNDQKIATNPIGFVSLLIWFKTIHFIIVIIIDIIYFLNWLSE